MSDDRQTHSFYSQDTENISTRSNLKANIQMESIPPEHTRVTFEKVRARVRAIESERVQASMRSKGKKSDFP